MRLKKLVEVAVVLVSAVIFFILSAPITFLGDDWRYLYEIENGQNIFSYILHPFLTAFA